MLVGCTPVSSVINHLGYAVIRSPKSSRDAGNIVPSAFGEELSRRLAVSLHALESAPVLQVRRVREDQLEVRHEPRIVQRNLRQGRETLSNLIVPSVNELEILPRDLEPPFDIRGMRYPDRRVSRLQGQRQR